MNEKGFTVVELLASFTLTMIIVVFLFEIVLELKDVYVANSLKTKVLNQNALIATKLDKDFDDLGIVSANCSANACTLNDAYNLTVLSDKLNFNDTQTIKMPSDVTIKNPSFSVINESFSSSTKDNSYIRLSFDVEGNNLSDKIHFNYVYTYGVYAMPYMRQSIFNDSTDNRPADIIRANITTIDFVDSISIPANASASWDVSENRDRSVMAWAVADSNNSGKYKLYLGGSGGVIANSNAFGVFNSFTNLTSINNISLFDTSRVTNMRNMFAYSGSLTSLDLSSWNTSKVTDMDNMFDYCSKLSSLNVSNFNTSNVAFMSGMFRSCYQLTSLDLSSFDTSNVIDMSKMFDHCRIQTVNLSSFRTPKLEYMTEMFAYCQSLTTLDLSNFNTSKITNMAALFDHDYELTSINLSNFNTANVTKMNGMFYGCRKLASLNLSSFNTKKVTTMQGMFGECAALTTLDLSSFDTSSVTNMSHMFTSGSHTTVGGFDMPETTMLLKTIYVSDKFVVSQVTDSTRMFYYCEKLVGGNGTKYSYSYIDKTYAVIDKSGTPGYFTKKT